MPKESDHSSFYQPGKSLLGLAVRTAPVELDVGASPSGQFILDPPTKYSQAMANSVRDGTSMNTGLLVLRFVFGALLVGHGSQKLFGLFGGPGLGGTGGFFYSLGFRPGRPMAILTGLCQAGGGAMVLLGLFTPLASAALIGTLVVVVSVLWASGLWAQNGGYELSLVYLTAATTLAFTGPGAYSLDKALGLDYLAGNGWGVSALLVGTVSGLAVVARGRRALASETVAGGAAREAAGEESPGAERVGELVDAGPSAGS